MLVMANVFLSGTTFGTHTNANGIFVFDIPRSGKYKLVVSCLGYQTYTCDTFISSQILDFVIKLAPKNIELNTLTVTAKDPHWAINYLLFTRLFLGSTYNSEDCYIENPNCIHFSYTAGVLKAWADSFIFINNRSLGYLIKYKLEYFEDSHQKKTFYGYPLFIDLAKNKFNKKQIYKRRLKTYYGSSMHFFRSLHRDSLKSEGFTTYKINSNIIPYDSAVVDRFVITDYAKKEKHKLEQTDEEVNLSNYIFNSTSSTTKQLLYQRPFEVSYHNLEEKKYQFNSLNNKGIIPRNGQQVTLCIPRDDNLVTFYPNGLYQIKSTSMAGYMAWKRIADMLPFDFDEKSTTAFIKK